MRTTIIVLLFGLAASPRLSAQLPDSIPRDVGAPSVLPSQDASASHTPKYDRPVSWKKLFPNLLSDEKRIWKFPFQVAGGNEVVPTTAVVGAAAGLIALDPVDAPYFLHSSSFHGFNQVFSDRSTAIGIAAIPASLYLIGLARKDSKMKNTAQLTIEAVASAELVATVVKDIDRRSTPLAVPPGEDFAHTWFQKSGSALRGIGSFPSGHTIAAFSVATVTARRYGNHRWVPYASYGLAALVGFSRVTLSGHFISDVFMGGVLGYSISRYTVLRQ